MEILLVPPRLGLLPRLDAPSSSTVLVFRSTEDGEIDCEDS